MKAGARLTHSRRFRVALVVGTSASAVVALLACASAPSLVGAGEECFVATDCAAGLVCVPQRGGARACSNDLSQVVGRPPPEAGGGDTGGDGPADGPNDGMPPSDAPGQDTSMPDTSMPDTSVADAAADG